MFHARVLSGVPLPGRRHRTTPQTSGPISGRSHHLHTAHDTQPQILSVPPAAGAPAPKHHPCTARFVQCFCDGWPLPIVPTPLPPPHPLKPATARRLLRLAVRCARATQRSAPQLRTVRSCPERGAENTGRVIHSTFQTWLASGARSTRSGPAEAGRNMEVTKAKACTPPGGSGASLRATPPDTSTHCAVPLPFIAA